MLAQCQNPVHEKQKETKRQQRFHTGRPDKVSHESLYLLTHSRNESTKRGMHYLREN